MVGRQVDEFWLIREIVMRWHQGQLTYEGGRRGAVFTVSLPPFNP